MTPHRGRAPLFLATVVAVLFVSSSEGADQGIAFQASPASTSAAGGNVSIIEPAGGQFTYSVEGQKVRIGPRFAIGGIPRTDYVIYSAEEQAGLDALREKLLASAAASAPLVAQAKAAPRAAAPRAVHKAVCSPEKNDSALTSAALPKVVRDDHKVCVPKLEYADQADWRDHLWCFDKGDGNVR